MVLAGIGLTCTDQLRLDVRRVDGIKREGKFCLCPAN